MREGLAFQKILSHSDNFLDVIRLQTWGRETDIFEKKTFAYTPAIMREKVISNGHNKMAKLDMWY